MTQFCLAFGARGGISWKVGLESEMNRVASRLRISRHSVVRKTWSITHKGSKAFWNFVNAPSKVFNKCPILFYGVHYKTFVVEIERKILSKNRSWRSNYRDIRAIVPRSEWMSQSLAISTCHHPNEPICQTHDDHNYEPNRNPPAHTAFQLSRIDAILNVTIPNYYAHANIIMWVSMVWLVSWASQSGFPNGILSCWMCMWERIADEVACKSCHEIAHYIAHTAI